MHLSVTYNPKTYDRFFAPVFTKFPSLEQSLLDDFVIYKATGKLPHYFGRDTLYDRPDEVKDAHMWHIHLELGMNKFEPPITPKGKHARKPDQATVQWHRTSDTCLVYVQNILDENQYSLLAVFHPWAHAEGQDYRQMRELAAVAKEFREDIF